MDLESAIQHLKESLADPTHKWGCEECKQEHEQLLAWLEEYHKIKEYWLPSDEEELRKERGECNNLYEKIDSVVSGLYSAITDQIVEKMGFANKYKQLEADYINLDNMLRTANTEIDRLRSESSWISCSERMPERDGFYLAYYTFTDGRHAYDIVYFNVGSPISSSISHWMPLPETPKEYK